MEERRPDFRLIKSRVSLLQVIVRYGIQLRANNSTSWSGDCPLPQHKSDSKNTFKVKLGERGGGWSCHSSTCIENRASKQNRQTELKKGGDLIEFVKFMEQLPSLFEAGRKLESWYGPFENVQAAEPQSQKVAAIEVVQAAARNEPLKFSLQNIQPRHEYLTSRGFEEEECEFLGVGFYSGKGSMANRIVFPIHSGGGELVGYSGRSTNGEEPRWKLPAGLHRGSELYNLHRVESESVVVVESFWGVLACVRAGIMNAVALMGNVATDEQVRLLGRFRTVSLMLDGDEAGREGTRITLGKLLSTSIQTVTFAALRDGEQPDTLSIDALRARLGIPPDQDGPLELVEALTFPRAVPA